MEDRATGGADRPAEPGRAGPDDHSLCIAADRTAARLPGISPRALSSPRRADRASLARVRPGRRSQPPQCRALLPAPPTGAAPPERVAAVGYGARGRPPFGPAEPGG